MGGGQHLIEFGRRGHGNGRRLPRKARQSPVDGFDQRPLLFHLARHGRGDLDHAFHRGQAEKRLLPPADFLGSLGHREGEPGAAVGLPEQFVFEVDAFQPLRLEVQQVVIVAQMAEADRRSGRGHDGCDQRQTGKGEQGPQPKTQIQRGGQIVLDAVGVAEADDRRQHGRFGQPAQQHAPAGEHSQLGHAGKFRQPGREERDRRGHGAGQNARSRARGGGHQGFAGRFGVLRSCR